MASDAFTHTMSKVPLFRAGDYGAKGNYTQVDLDEIVASYSPALLSGRVTRDHIQDGPNNGVVRKVWRDGDTLYGELATTPEFDSDIKSRKYYDRSVEIYRSLKAAGGKPYLKAVTFLGAGAPEVKGLGEIQFSEDGNGECVAIPFECFGDSLGADAFPRPDGVASSVMTKTARVDDMLGHYHIAVVDDQKSGFTSVPMFRGDDYSDEPERGGHQHRIVGGVVMPEADSNGTMHTHKIPDYAGFSESKNEDTKQEVAIMADQGKEPVVSFKDTDEYKTMFAEIESLKADKERLASEARKTASDAARDALFSELFNEKTGPVVTEADRQNFSAVFSAITARDEVVKFSESENATVKQFAELLRGRGPRISTDTVTTPGNLGSEDSGVSVSKFDDKRVLAAAKELQAQDKTLSFEDAYTTASKTLKGGK